MATIAVATADDVNDVKNGSLHPGRTQNTAGGRAGRPLTEEAENDKESGQIWVDSVRSLAAARYG